MTKAANSTHHVVKVNERVIDRDNFDALLQRHAHHQSSNTTETVQAHHHVNTLSQSVNFISLHIGLSVARRYRGCRMQGENTKKCCSVCGLNIVLLQIFSGRG